MRPKAAGLAKKMGYNNVKVYVDGEPMWRFAGYYYTPEFVKSGNIVLIDLRSPDAVKEGHIPRAANIPVNKLKEAEDKFPSKNTPVIFYSDREDDLVVAVTTAREWGYKRATVFSGGMDAWKAKGYELKKGPAATEIKYARKLELGEISIPDFEKALKSELTYIVDVRTKEEYTAGHYSGAVNIPRPVNLL